MCLDRPIDVRCNRCDGFLVLLSSSIHLTARARTHAALGAIARLARLGESPKHVCSSSVRCVRTEKAIRVAVKRAIEGRKDEEWRIEQKIKVRLKGQIGVNRDIRGYLYSCTR